MSTSTLRPPKTMSAAVRRTRARRAVALAGMLAAIGSLVGVRAALTPAPAPALGSQGLASPTGSAGGRHHHHHQKSGAGSRTGGATKRVVVGHAYDVGYGVVQVKVTLKGSHITDVATLSLPQGGHSGDISAYAAPQLRREALNAQSAHIDTVSGASYTSSGYAQSLQSALDQATR